MATADYDAALEKLGLILPKPNVPAANYSAFIRQDNQLYISGQTCKLHGRIVFNGVVGDSSSKEEGYQAAKLCAINILSQVKQACGGTLNKVERCLKMTVYVQSHKRFTEQAWVANGASDLMVEVFGEAGRHVRSAIGCNVLPSGSTVEIDAIFVVK